jgi:hypothetical protein
VFLARRPGSAALTPYPIKDAAAYFLKSMSSPGVEGNEARVGELLEFGAWMLSYSDPEDAVRTLEQLV